MSFHYPTLFVHPFTVGIFAEKKAEQALLPSKTAKFPHGRRSLPFALGYGNKAIIKKLGACASRMIATTTPKGASTQLVVKPRRAVEV